MKNKNSRLFKQTLASFFLALLLCSTLIGITVNNRSHVEKLEMEQLIMEKSVKINEVITKLLYKTEALSALVLQGGGDIKHFEEIAPTIVDDPAILNILIAPEGVVSKVYPLQGNEGVIGLNFFEKGAGNKEAILAKEKKELVFGGPFELIQGGEALVGRLPVYFDVLKSDNNFWGLVSVTLKFPEALEGAQLDILGLQGFTYEIWRINPDDNKKQVIASSNINGNSQNRYIEKPIPILNADWHFRVSPVKMWYHYPETWLLIIIGLFISTLTAYIVQKNAELKQVKRELEAIACQDYLTGIFNRRHFMEVAPSHIDEAVGLNKHCFVVIMDLDHFKLVNDTYGHIAGDKVLKGVVERLRKVVLKGRKNLLARYGGEEFIMLVIGDNEMAGKKVAELACENVNSKPFKVDGVTLPCTGSFGVANVISSNHFDEAIRHADVALYMAKEEGRNKVVCYEDAGEDSF